VLRFDVACRRSYDVVGTFERVRVRGVASRPNSSKRFPIAISIGVDGVEVKLGQMGSAEGKECRFLQEESC
jgi:hypothetical protein